VMWYVVVDVLVVAARVRVPSSLFEPR
jgi:hypothetical protein